MLNAGEPVLVCPYNKAHSIIKSRMQFHLVKCRMQNPNSEKVVCPFDSTHIVPKVELEFHQQICEKRIVLDSFLYDVGSSKCPIEEVPTDVPPEALAPCEENWDEDPAVSVLDVIKEGAKGKKVLLNLIGVPKAERKAHRVQERLRFQRVCDSNEIGKETKNKNKENCQKNKEAQSSEKEKSSMKHDNSAPDKTACNLLPHKSFDNEKEGSSQASNLPEISKEENCANRKSDEDDFEVVKSHKKTQGKKNKKSQQNIRRPPPPANALKRNDELNHMTKLNGERIENKDNASGCVHSEVERRPPEMKITRNAWEKPLNMGRGKSAALNSSLCPIDDFPSLPVSGRGRGLMKF